MSLVILLRVAPAAASCVDGQLGGCTLPLESNDNPVRCSSTTPCPGERTCYNGQWGPCEAAVLPESCNCCDDDRDGDIDENLKWCNQTGEFEPPGCPSNVDTEVAFVSDSREFLGRWVLGPALYAGPLDYSWRLHLNASVDRISLNLTEFGTELEDDRLEVGGLSLSGVAGADGPWLGWRELPAWGDGRVDWHFVTDDDAERGRGFRFSGARVRCQAASQSPIVHPITILSRVEGLLLATGDTQFFRLELNAGADEALYIVMEGLRTTAPGDFDLFVREKDLPQKHKWDYRAISTRMSEGVRIALPPGSTTWYIAVTSYVGSGSFRLWVSRAKFSEERTLTAGVADVHPDPGLLIKTLSDAQKIAFGMTEGQMPIQRVHFFNEGECLCAGDTCDLCFTHDACGTSSCWSPSSGQIKIYTDHWDQPMIVAHEFGHFPLGGEDEYDGTNVCGQKGRAVCGHTIMGPSNDHSRNLCNVQNHRVDGDPLICEVGCSGDCGAAGCVKCWEGYPPFWETALQNGRVLDEPIGTLDDSDFSSHDGLRDLLTAGFP